MLNEELISQLRSKLRQVLPDLELLYLFGSVAAGEEHGGSDLDLAVLHASPTSKWEFWMLSQKLSLEMHRQIDLVDLHEASTVLKMEVVSKGQLLFEKNPDQRAEFEMLAFSDYARLNEERRGILQDVRQRGSIYG
ncbi:MAG: nucleotidyltransferase domain-containing protein [Candidatus Firestonebacteria bacterium]|nr:nucleotidyltransferase domain-containing protein [Candidatus Firestonebacteria bacterium]